MNVLGTKFSTAMGARNGWFTINEVLDDTFKHYTFNQCLKLKVTPETKDDMNFIEWVMYWEGSPVAVHLHVLTTVLSTGYVKATVISKRHVFTDEIGEFPGKQAIIDGYMIDGKFMDKKGAEAYHTRKLMNGDFRPAAKIPDAVIQPKRK